MQRKNKFEVRLTSSAQKDLDRLPSDIFENVIETLKSLSSNPRPAGCKKLDKNCYRVRTGNYRALYFIETDFLLIARIRHRREVYANLKKLIKRLS